MNAIIRTNSWEQAVRLHEVLGDTRFRSMFEGQYPWNRRDYDKDWWWVRLDGDLAGSSGHRVPEYTVERHPLLPIYSLEGFMAFNRKSVKL